MSWKLKYEILENECLGKGNFGAVYLAKRKNENTRICVKLIKQNQQYGHHVLFTNAMNEFEIANQMKGKQFINLVNIYDVYQEDENEYAYIFMEKCEGNILDFLKKNNQKTMNDNQIDELIRQISNGYCELSEKNIIHRDLKPENILYNVDVMGNLIFKIADFGLGKIVQESSIDMTQLVGTPFYRAPEVINDEQYDNKCDLYSLGVIIYYMIVGEEKFNKEFINHEVIQEQLRLQKFSEIISLQISAFQYDYTDLLDQLINLNPNQRSTWQDLTKWFPQIHTRPRNHTVGAVPQKIKFQTLNPNQLKRSFTFNDEQQQESTPTGRNSINPQNNQQNQNLQNVGSPLQNKFQQQPQAITEFNLQQQQTKQNVSQNNFPMNNQFSQIQSGQFQKNIRLQTNTQQNNQFQIQLNNNQADNSNQFKPKQLTNNVQQNTQRFPTMQNNNNQTLNPNQNIQIMQPATNLQQNTQFQNNNNQAQNSNQFQPNVQQQPKFQTQNVQQSSNPSAIPQQNSLQKQQSEKIFKFSQNSQISNKQGFQNVIIFPQKQGIQQNPFPQQNQNPQENNKNNNIDSASTSGQLSQEIGKQKEI